MKPLLFSNISSDRESTIFSRIQGNRTKIIRDTILYTFLFFCMTKRKETKEKSPAVCRALPKIISLGFRRRQNSLRSNSISAYRNPRSIFDTRHNAGSNRHDNTHHFTWFFLCVFVYNYLNNHLSTIHFCAVAMQGLYTTCTGEKFLLLLQVCRKELNTTT